jgi:hypothetical protein
VAGSGAGWGLETMGLGVLSVGLEVSVGVLALLSESGSLSLGVVCVTASTVMVGGQ